MQDMEADLYEAKERTIYDPKKTVKYIKQRANLASQAGAETLEICNRFQSSAEVLKIDFRDWAGIWRRTPYTVESETGYIIKKINERRW